MHSAMRQVNISLLMDASKLDQEWEDTIAHNLPDDSRQINIIVVSSSTTQIPIVLSVVTATNNDCILL